MLDKYLKENLLKLQCPVLNMPLSQTGQDGRVIKQVSYRLTEHYGNIKNMARHL